MLTCTSRKYPTARSRSSGATAPDWSNANKIAFSTSSAILGAPAGRSAGAPRTIHPHPRRLAFSKILVSSFLFHFCVGLCLVRSNAVATSRRERRQHRYVLSPENNGRFQAQSAAVMPRSVPRCVVPPRDPAATPRVSNARWFPHSRARLGRCRGRCERERARDTRVVRPMRVVLSVSRARAGWERPAWSGPDPRNRRARAHFYHPRSAHFVRATRSRSPTLTSLRPTAAMAEVTSSGVPLMGAVNKIKDSAMHVFAQVRARARWTGPDTRARKRRCAPHLPRSRWLLPNAASSSVFAKRSPPPVPPLVSETTQRKPMSEILDRTAYQRPGSFSEVRLLDRVQTQARDSRRTCSSEIFPFRRKG